MSTELDPKRLRTMGAFRWLLVVLSAVVALGSWWTYLHAAGPEGSSQTAPKYQCPMHPSIVSNQPGTCPICGMNLEPITKNDGHEHAVTAPYTLEDAGFATLGDAGAAKFFCPMHPEVKSAAPGTCPICSMKLEAIPPAPVSGLAPVTLTLDRQQAIGVRTATATQKDASATVRATASVAAPEQGVSEVHVRTPGFVERVAVRETGARVGAGQELFAMYSPEIWQTEAELVASRGMPSLFGDAGIGDRVTSAARQKLEILGMSPRAIDEVVATGKPARAISVVAPASGWVTRKNVVLGSYVTPETVLYEIVDLSRVYVVADVFSADLADVKVGSEGTFTVTGSPEPGAKATVDLVYPSANPEARTTRVRMQVANKDMRFRPGQYGTVEIARPAHKGVFVPRDAVVDTGQERYVFVDEGEGRLVPRNVDVGIAQGDDVEIKRGVSAGERVVAGATFLVDSESRLRAALERSTSAARKDGGAP